MNKKYEVEMWRIGSGCRTITVEAASEEEARRLAYDQAGNHLYSESHCAYDIEDVTEVEK